METLANTTDVNTMPVISDIIQKASVTTIPTAKIRINPKNYRKMYDEKELLVFAGQIKKNGILSSLVLRPAGKNMFELVAGERRYRAAQIIGLNELPAKVVELNDEQVLEIQLDENLHRENTHPLDDAAAIRLMLDSGKNIEEISLRLGKSKGLIYNRIKLSELIDPIKEMFMANILTLQAAIEISALSADSQEHFFKQHCKDWKKKGFNLQALSNLLGYYKFNLKTAPFDTNDKTLIEEAGTCTKCPFNSATVQSLFPETSKSAICSNKSCFRSKSDISLERSIQAIMNEAPKMLITSYSLTDIEKEVLQKFPSLSEIPNKNVYDINRCQIPQPPKEEDFYIEGKGGKQSLDKKGFAQAMDEFKTELEEFNLMLETGKVNKAIYIHNNAAHLIYYRVAKQGNSTGGVTAKEVQEAIQAGKATPELLNQEIQRLQSRETRAKELDAEKVQLAVHAAFTEHAIDFNNIKDITKADMASIKWMIFLTLDYTNKEKAIKTLFPKLRFNSLKKDKQFIEISKLTDRQLAYLIRMNLAGKSDSKHPMYATSYFLYQSAIDAGIDVKAIKAEQDEKAQLREKRMKERIADLQKQIRTLSKNKK